MQNLIYLCDIKRHLICQPYSIENLHQMALDLKIKRCHYSFKSRKTGNIHPHYDIPKRRFTEISQKCQMITDREIFQVIQDALK